MNFFKVGLMRLFGLRLARGRCVVVSIEDDEGTVGEIVKPKGGNSSGSDKSREKGAVAVVFEVSFSPIFFTLSSVNPRLHGK